MDGLMPKPHYPSLISTGRDLTFDLITAFTLYLLPLHPTESSPYYR